MKTIVRVLTLWLGVAGAAVVSEPTLAQPASDKIEVAYYAPKSQKYLPMVDRLRSFRLLEQLGEFLAPLRLPHKFGLTIQECGTINAFYSPSEWRMQICYEFVEAVERFSPKQDEKSDVPYEEIVIGALVGTLLHEAGHAVFDMYNVPVFGRQEDAADAIATFIALQFNENVARMMVKGFSYMQRVWFAFGGTNYSDEHGTGLQRYYNTLCIAYGGAPRVFQEYITKGDLPKERADNCANEYQQVKFAFDTTLKPFIDQEAMEKVRARPWLQLNPAQASLLRQQQLKEPVFGFSFCNFSKHPDLSLALMSKSMDAPHAWRTEGWFGIADGGCSFIGSFYGDKIYFYAETSDKMSVAASSTDPTASKQCVDATKSFGLNAGSPCRAGQKLVNFIMREIDPTAATVTVRLD
jgi:uncharacterized membrane protein